MRRATFRLMLLVFAAGYLAAVTWVCLRPAAQAAARPVTLRLAHWQIERGPPAGLAAARAAGVRVVGITSTLDAAAMAAQGPDSVAGSPAEVSVEMLRGLTLREGALLGVA